MSGAIPRRRGAGALTPEAFQRFLEWLAGSSGATGDRYLEMRRRLVSYFQRKRCAFADDLADETLTRVARRLEEEGEIEGAAPAQYCYIVARFVLLEHWRADEQRQTAIVPAPWLQADGRDREGADGDRQERTFDCLDRCLERLRPLDRTLIREYYQEQGANRIVGRRQLAQRLGLSANALAIKASRIRQTLEGCVRECLALDDRSDRNSSQQEE